MKARWRARVSASYCADGCSNVSRQSRMIFKIVTALALRLDRQKDAPERPLIVTPPCQSEIKRTLRYAVPQAKTARSPGFHTPRDGSFGADGERRVSTTRPVWFRNGGCTQARPFDYGKPSSIKNLRRIKSIGFFTHFPRFDLDANTCDLST